MATYYSSVTKPDKLRPNDVYIMDVIPDDWVLDKIQGEPDTPIIIKPLPNQIKTIGRLRISDTCTYLYLDGLEHLVVTGVTDDNKPLVEIWGSHIGLQRLHLNTTPNAQLHWTNEDWEAYARKGFVVRGSHVSLTQNRITNTSFAIELYGEFCQAIQNNVLHFCGDGIRGLNNHQVIMGNLTAYAHVGNTRNHLDHIQLWNCTAPTPQQGILTGMQVRDNFCYNPPNYAPCQGIGCYDGTITDSLFENNIVGTNHQHLLTLASAQNCALRDNHLYNTSPADDRGLYQDAWLMLGTTKPDHPTCSGNTVINNHIPRLAAQEGAGECRDNQGVDKYLAWQLLKLRATLAQESFV
jgi:hypothetical protein